MPKSRKRKGAKKHKTKQASETPETRAESETNISRKEGFFEHLYGEDAKVFKQLLSYFPVISGSCLASGLRLQNGTTFLLIMGIVSYVHYLDLIFSGKLPLYRTKKIIFSLHGAAAACIVGFFFLTRSLEASAALMMYGMLGICRFVLTREDLRGITLYSVAVVLQMMLLAILGAYSQYPAIFFPIALVGFIPACYLVSADIAFEAKTFEAAGWHRSYEVKKGSDVIERPSGLTRLFTLFLVLGPLFPITFSPINLLPMSFLLCALPIYFLPSIGTAFLERLQSDRLISLRCVHLAFLASILALFSGLLAQF